MDRNAKKRHVGVTIFLLSAALASFWPFTAGADSFSYAVWIPYWRKDPGAAEVLAHLKSFQEISPFAYEVRSDGTLADKLKIGQDPWPGLFAAVASGRAKIIPTASWMDGDAILQTLASAAGRSRHISQIVDTVRSNNFGGIDVDYENKKAETRPYFSKFLKELSAKLHKDKKILSCSIESRTPIRSRFAVVPKDLKYANDLSVIGRYCDEVRILAYDQNNIDLKLNKEKGGDKLYAPVADIDWVKKVIREALKSISPKKIMLGIPTFGYEYEITEIGLERQGYAYQKIRSVSYQTAMRLAQSASTTPVRNSAGEISFTYQITGSSTPPATSTSTRLGLNGTRLVWFPDAASAQAKIKLAKAFKLRGIAIFKADGESDPLMWQVLK